MLLDMGEPVPIRLLAETMIRLAGFTERTEANPRGDIAIKVTGPRRGEKLTEELFYAPGEASPTRHPKILRAGHETSSEFHLDAALAALREALSAGDEARARLVLFGLPDSDAVPTAMLRSAAV
jgi:FlaA1/EpsC-like NDP-sugar epimerase